MVSVQSLSGQQIGQYELKALLGTGGMSAVYHAYQPALDRQVAVKVLTHSPLNDATYVQRFMQEARTIARLEHPHIVPIYDYGTEDDLSFIVMRLLTGGTLAQRFDYRMNRGEPLPSLGEVNTLLRQLASALDYAHAHGVIHRDIKTGNVMFDQQGVAYLVDFGIAKLMDSTAVVTLDGIMLGTPSYMAPEQWHGIPLTPAADQYALGVLVYLLVTGRMPYSGSTYPAMMREHISARLPTLANLPPSVAAKLYPVLDQALAKAPERRFPTVRAFAEAFGRAVHGLEGTKTYFSTFALPENYPIAPPSLRPVPNDIPTPPSVSVIRSDHPVLAQYQSGHRKRVLALVLAGITIGLVILLGLLVAAYLIFVVIADTAP